MPNFRRDFSPTAYLIFVKVKADGEPDRFYRPALSLLSLLP